MLTAALAPGRFSHVRLVKGWRSDKEQPLALQVRIGHGNAKLHKPLRTLYTINGIKMPEKVIQNPARYALGLSYNLFVLCISQSPLPA